MARKKRKNKKDKLEEKKVSIQAAPVTDSGDPAENIDENSPSLTGILGGEDEPIPEFLEIEEALALRALLPSERLLELNEAAKKFVSSIVGEKPKNHSEWLDFYFRSAEKSFEQNVSLLMMTMTAELFIDWFTTLLVLHRSQVALRKTIVREMIVRAKSVRERATATSHAKELGIEMPEVA